MTRGSHLTLMLPFAVALPLVLVILMVSMFQRGGSHMNIPNRDYWLADRRRDATVAFLINHVTRLAIGMIVFLCFVHKLMVDANTRRPSALDNASIIGGLVVVLVCVMIWIAWLYFALRLPARR